MTSWVAGCSLGLVAGFAPLVSALHGLDLEPSARALLPSLGVIVGGLLAANVVSTVRLAWKSVETIHQDPEKGWYTVRTVGLPFWRREFRIHRSQVIPVMNFSGEPESSPQALSIIPLGENPGADLLLDFGTSALSTTTASPPTTTKLRKGYCGAPDKKVTMESWQEIFLIDNHQNKPRPPEFYPARHIQQSRVQQSRAKPKRILTRNK